RSRLEREVADVRCAVAVAARIMVGAAADPARAGCGGARRACILGLPLDRYPDHPPGSDGGRMTRVLVVDNYDSFVYTLNGYLIELGAQTAVVRNDAFQADAAAERIADYDAVLLSPGPGTPAAAGVSFPVVHATLEAGKPLLGVCLGHQAIAEA